MSAWNSILNKRSPRYFKWWQILEAEDVPLLAALPLVPLPFQVSFSHTESDIDVYKLDLARFSNEQMRRLVKHVAGEYCVWEAVARTELEAVGLPIRAADVVVYY